MTSVVITHRVLPRSRAMGAVLVLAAAAITALAAQWEIHLGFTPVPITGQTFAVLLTGAALGARLGAAGQILYVSVGALGAPVFSGGSGGWEQVRAGGTAGYLIGFVLAAALIGKLAERRQDRTFPTMFTAFVVGSLLIYVSGVAGLMATFGWDVSEAVARGVVPFLAGDLIKGIVAGLILPGAWRLLGERS